VLDQRRKSRLGASELGLRLLDVGDVGGDPAHSDRRTSRVEQRELHRQVCTRFAARQQRLLDLQRLSCRENLLVVSSQGVSNLGWEDVMAGLSDRIFAPDPERGLQVAVDELEASVDVLEVDSRRGIVEDVLQPFFTLALSVLSSL